MALSYEQKARALAAIGPDMHIKPATWASVGWCAVLPDVEIKSGGLAKSPLGRGGNPEEAVENLWMAYVTELEANEYLIIKGLSNRRRAVKWNGFMWADIVEDK